MAYHSLSRATKHLFHASLNLTGDKAGHAVVGQLVSWLVSKLVSWLVSTRN